MVYQIYYIPKGAKERSRGVCMFDIEYYMKQHKETENTWYSEIHCLPCVDGLCDFIRDKVGEEGFDFDAFVRDAAEIQEIRGLLYEKHYNRPKEEEEARKFHYDIFGKEIRALFDLFCKQYGLYLNID